VEFASADIASQAMNKHKEKIGHRLGGKLGHAWVKFLLGVCGGLYIEVVVSDFSLDTLYYLKTTVVLNVF
jgi:hypothetical protein